LEGEWFEFNRGYKPQCSWGIDLTAIEAAAAALGLLNVWLIIRRSIWNYPPGLVMVVLYAWIFYDAKLYSDVLLQIFFFFFQLYGWVDWTKNKSLTGEVRVDVMEPAAFGVSLCWVAGGAWMLGSYMAHQTDASFPYLDAFIAIASVVAQALTSRRKLESWLLWIAVDVIAIGVYAAKDLYITAGLYTLFLCLAVSGYFSWQASRPKALRGATAET
jgi:nicotinamide mononucleotide transporter